MSDSIPAYSITYFSRGSFSLPNFTRDNMIDCISRAFTTMVMAAVSCKKTVVLRLFLMGCPKNCHIIRSMERLSANGRVNSEVELTSVHTESEFSEF